MDDAKALVPPPDAPNWSRGKGGRLPGSPRVPGSGRPSGGLNRTTAEIRQFILHEGKPHEFLVRVMRGAVIQRPDGSTWRPEPDHSLQAAKWLFERVVPLAHQHEVGGIIGLAALLRDLPVLADDDAGD